MAALALSSTSSPRSTGSQKRAAESTSFRRKKRTSPAYDTRDIRNDRLGTLVKELCKKYHQSESWESFVHQFRGRSYLSPSIEEVEHPAIPLLTKWRNEGVPAESCSEPWSVEQTDLCIKRGCHTSAKEHAAFLRDEMSDFIENKFWMVLPYDMVRGLPSLQLSPASVKDERDRRPRLICDHSWNWGWPALNETATPHAPLEAMQFGGALPRILHKVRHANQQYGPVRLCKHDIKDGFYRMFLRASDCVRLTIVLPKYDNEPQLVAIPMSTTMGFTNSPPSFSNMSETVCDLGNQHFLDSPAHAEPHRLEEAASAHDDLSPSWEPRPREVEDEAATKALLQLCPNLQPDTTPDIAGPPSNRPFTKPLGTNDVFVDDFIQLGQGGKNRMMVLRRHLLHAVDEILAQPTLEEKHRNEAISLKKLLKGDGSWNTRKLVLGWIIDTIRQTIELPAHRKESLAQIFNELKGAKRVSNKSWMSILGKLRFVSVAVPGSAGLFCALQLALTKANGNRIRITRHLRAHLDAFASLAASLCDRPTYLAEIVPEEPTLLGATDACKHGMGGVYFDPQGRAIVWRCPFPPDIQAKLVSVDNPSGTLTNSDLEQAALLAQISLQSSTHDTTYATVLNFCDNTPAISRETKGAISSDGLGADLCNYSCLLQRQERYCHLVQYLPGPDNVMGDDASRMQDISDLAFHAHFQQAYPQSQPWELHHLPDAVSSHLISLLRSRLPTLAPPPRLGKPLTPTSDSGPSSAPSSARIHPSVISPTKRHASATSSSSASDTAKPAKPASLSALIQWIRPYWPWDRGSPTWVNLIPASSLDKTSSIPYSMLFSGVSEGKTPRPLESTHATLPSSSSSNTSSTPPTICMANSTPTPLTSSLSPSSGFFVPPNTLTPPPRELAPKPSASVTSTLPSTAKSTVPPTRL